jgi:hypothetical protein
MLRSSNTSNNPIGRSNAIRVRERYITRRLPRRRRPLRLSRSLLEPRGPLVLLLRVSPPRSQLLRRLEQLQSPQFMPSLRLLLSQPKRRVLHLLLLPQLRREAKPLLPPLKQVRKALPPLLRRVPLLTKRIPLPRSQLAPKSRPPPSLLLRNPPQRRMLLLKLPL